MRRSTWTRSVLPIFRLRQRWRDVPQSSIGVSRLLLARAIEDRAELELCKIAISSSNTVVCRLTASVEAMEPRVKLRESGVLRRDYIARVAELNTTLDRAKLENFTKKVAAPAETRTPNLHRANKSRSLKSADGRVATVATRLGRNIVTNKYQNESP